MKTNITFKEIKTIINEIGYRQFDFYKYKSANEFFDEVEMYVYTEVLDELVKYLNLYDKNELIECIKVPASKGIVKEIGKKIYIYGKIYEIYDKHYIADAHEIFESDYYDFSRDFKCFCKVCDREIEYSSLDSVMLTDENWNKVISFYNLKSYELSAEIRKTIYNQKIKRRGNIIYNPPDNCCTFICNDCIEKAIGHDIGISDINDSPFNYEYIREHFKK
jgi:hypothetical protein